MNNNKNLRILVFDDNAAIRALLETVLSGLGHEVLAYENPTICEVYQYPEEHCSQHFPCADIVITDNMMPKMTGIEYLLLMEERCCKVPTANKAIMSAGIKPEQREIITKLGCHFFKKPFKISDVKSWVNECAGRVSGDRTLAKLIEQLEANYHEEKYAAL